MHKIIFIVLSLFATSSFATELVDIYQSQLAVANQESLERERVSPDILRQVLLKVVGDRSVLDAANLTPILSDVGSLVQQSQYLRLSETVDDLMQPDQLALSLSFNEAAVNQTLTNNGLPIWSKSRPDVMIWVAIDDGLARRILTADDDASHYTYSLERAAARRGLPIVLPIMDLQDQSQISPDVLWTGVAGPVEQASQRYGVKIILLARITILTNDMVHIDWQSMGNGATEQWQSEGEVSPTLATGIDEFTDRLARGLTQVVTSQDQSPISSLEINSVRDYADYSRTMTYLASLQYVSDLQMVTLEDDKLVVTMQIKGDKAVLTRTLAIDHVIEQESAAGTVDDVMHYRLLP
tara:strand:+ start:33839 stop:34897 length:1059 start_codon:yes stop_codon:yes gene_type:complete